jgi:heptosyltransferase-2
MQKFLVIQTAFIGDVVLATGLLEKLHEYFPKASIDIAVRKGNESMFVQHPFLHEVLVWDKKNNKYRNLFQLLKRIRAGRYDCVINVQRYAATGLLTAFSRAKRTIGFDKNPFSFLFSDVIRHVFDQEGKGVHETERNHQLIASFTDEHAARPKLYPSVKDRQTIMQWQEEQYICMAPASVWFTKQFPVEQWIALVNALPKTYKIYLLGAPGDQPLCNEIIMAAENENVENLSGRLNFLQSAALMQGAVMNYVNDSAPMHFASAVNAPVTAVYCSTVPAFGYGPLSDTKHIVEVQEHLLCRPCGLHGKKACPENHFNCARHISIRQLLDCLPH